MSTKNEIVVQGPKIPFIPVEAFKQGRIKTNLTAHGESVFPCKYKKD